MRLGILGSTRGTVLQAVIAAVSEKKLAAEISMVISNLPDAGILEKAKNVDISAKFVDPAGLTRAQYDEKLSEILADVDVVVLIGYMRILSKNFIDKFRDRIINIHPSLLPEFAGGMDRGVHREVLAAGKKETGCTVHLVTEDLDAGPILVQKKCVVENDDTVETLKARVQVLEGEALVEAILSLRARFIARSNPERTKPIRG